MPNRKIPRSFISLIAFVLFVSATIINAQTANAKQKPTGSISGQVTIDGKAAAGIPVAAVEGQSVNRQDAPARAFSDVEGNYQINGLRAGEYQVWTLTPSFVAEPSTSPYFSYPGAAKSVLLGADENVTGVDLKLIRGAVITGRVTNAENKPVVEERVKFQLIDANGNPRLGGAIGNTYDQMFQTDDRGVYRIFDLPPGRYRVSVGYDAASDGLTRARRYDQTFYLDSTDQAKPGVVELTEGSEAKDIDIRVGAVAATFAVSGRVIDSETGVGIAKAAVSFTMPQKDKNTPAPPGMNIQSDDRGEFRWEGFSPGHYIVMPNPDSYGGGGDYYGDPVSVEITDKDVTGLELRTVPGLTLSGYVSADGLSTKELMSLLPNLVIVANGVIPGNTQLRSGARATVMPDGTFQIVGLRPSPYSMWVTTQRPSSIRTIINRMDRDGVAVNQNFEMKESLSGLHIVIDYGTGVIRGTVKFEGGDVPITETRMAVTLKREGARDQSFTEVDARGHFVLTNLAPGPFELTLTVNSLTPRTRSTPGIPPQKQIVNVTNGAETEVTFVVNLGPKPGGPQ